MVFPPLVFGDDGSENWDMFARGLPPAEPATSNRSRHSWLRATAPILLNLAGGSGDRHPRWAN